MPRAVLLFHDKAALGDGGIIEMTIWQFAEVTPERPHRLKYSLYYGRDGTRIVGYDNERGKSDHRHYRGVEEVYRFTSVEQLVADFLADVKKEQAL